MADERERPVYTMQVAAELLGAHPQTLRNYERAGLVRPRRSGGNQRLYSGGDIARLGHLRDLAERHGLTMETLGLVAGLQAGLDALAALLAGPPGAARWAAARAAVAALLALLASDPAGGEEAGEEAGGGEVR